MAATTFPPEIEELRKVVKSLVIPSGLDGISIRRLCDDYQEMEGTTMPYSKHGFGNVRDFLLSSYFKDLLIRGHNADGFEVFKAHRDSKTAHIQELVACQMKNKKRSKKKTTFHMAGFNRHNRPGFGLTNRRPPSNLSKGQPLRSQGLPPPQVPHRPQSNSSWSQPSYKAEALANNFAKLEAKAQTDWSWGNGMNTNSIRSSNVNQTIGTSTASSASEAPINWGTTSGRGYPPAGYSKQQNNWGTTSEVSRSPKSSSLPSTTTSASTNLWGTPSAKSPPKRPVNPCLESPVSRNFSSSFDLASSLGEKPIDRMQTSAKIARFTPQQIVKQTQTTPSLTKTDIPREGDVITHPVDHLKYFRQLEDQYLSPNSFILKKEGEINWIGMRLTTANSPSILFFTLLSEESTISELNQEINAFYSEGGPGRDARYIIAKENWAKGLLVAVPDPTAKDDKKFLRALLWPDQTGSLIGHLIDKGGCIRLKEGRVFYLPFSRFAAGKFGKGFAFKMSLLGVCPPYQNYISDIDQLTVGETSLMLALKKKGYSSRCAQVLMQTFAGRSLSAACFRPNVPTSPNDQPEITNSKKPGIFAFVCDITDEEDSYLADVLAAKNLVERIPVSKVHELIEGKTSEEKVREFMIENAAKYLELNAKIRRTSISSD